MRNFIDAFTVSTNRKLKAFRKNSMGNISHNYRSRSHPHDDCSRCRH